MLGATSRWAIVLLVWAAVGGLLSLELYLSFGPEQPGLSFGMAAFGQYMRVVLWALLTPVVFWLQRRFPVTVRNAGWSVPLHAVLALAAMAVIYIIRFAVIFHLFEEKEMSGSFWWHAGKAFHPRNVVDIAIYAVIHGVGFTLGTLRDMRETRVRAVQLENDLAQAEVRALKAQLQPHFLFNTLNTISALVRDQQNAEAVRLIGKLGALLRLALENAGHQEVALRHELDFLSRYLEIQQARFTDRLEVIIDVDPDALDAMVPNLLIQPLVENAVIHGFSQRTGRGCVSLAVRRSGDRLQVTVRDDGPGFPESGAAAGGGGIGLSNTRGRLERMFGAAARIDCRNRPEGGAEVVVELPFRSATGGPQAHGGDVGVGEQS